MANGKKNLAKGTIDVNDPLIRALNAESGLSGTGEIPVISSVGAGKPLQSGSIEEFRGYIPDSGIFAQAGRGALEETRAANQSSWEQWRNGVTKLVGKTATATLGGTVGTLAGIGQAVYDGSFNSFFDNEFQRWMDDWNEWMDVNLPNYYTKEAQEYNLGRSLGTANFWANDFLGGLSFTIGAILTEATSAAVAGATLGAGTPLLAGTTARNVAKAAKIIKKFQKAGALNQGNKAATFARQLVTGSFYEAGVEARHFKREAEKLFLERLGKTKDQLTQQEALRMENEINTIANGVFAANAALVSFGNFMTLPQIFGKGLRGTQVGKVLKTDELSKKAAARLGKEASDPFVSAYKTFSRTRQAAGKVGAFVKPLLAEGIGEEGGQSVVSNSALLYAGRRFDPEANGGAYDLFETFGEGLKETFGSKEGWKEIGLGMLIGGVGAPNIQYNRGDSPASLWTGGAWGSYTEHTQKQKATDNVVDWMNRNKDVAASTKAMWQNAIQQYSAAKQIDAALEIDDFFSAKNAENDGFFSYVTSRIKGGYYSEIQDELVDSIEKMSAEEFGDAFGYSDLTQEELSLRKSEVVAKTMDRVKSVKKAVDLAARVDKTNNEDVQIGLAHSIAALDNVDEREARLSDSIQNKLGGLDTRELKEVAAANNRIKFKNNHLKKYKQSLAGYKSAKTKLQKATMFKPLDEEGLEKIKAAEDKVRKAERKVREYEKEIQDLVLQEHKDRFGKDYDGNITDFREAVNRNLELRDKLEKHYESEPTDKEEVEAALSDLEKLATRRQDFIEQYNILQTKEGQEEFISQLGNLKDQIGKELTKREALTEAYRRKGQYIKSLPDLEESAVTEEDVEDKFSELRSDTTSDTFNRLKNQMLTELDNIPEGDTLRQRLANAQKTLAVLNKYKTKFQDMLDTGPKDSELYNKMIQELDNNLIPDVKNKIEALKEAIKKDGEKPQGKVIFRAEELTQVFFDFISPEAKQLLHSLSEEELRENVTLEIRDYPQGDQTKPAKGSSKVDVFLGVTDGTNRGKGVYILYNGQIIGGLKDPNRFKLKDGKQLNPLNDAHLALLNPDFVDSLGVPTDKGIKVQMYYSTLVDIWKDIYEGKESFSNEEISNLFYVNKRTRIINQVRERVPMEQRPTVGEFFNNSDYNLNYTYEIAGEGETSVSGLVFVNEGLDEFYVKDQETNTWRLVEFREERAAIIDQLNKALKVRNIKPENISSTYMIVSDGTNPTILDSRLPLIEIDNDGKTDLINKAAEEVERIQKELDAGNENVRGTEVDPNYFISLKNASGVRVYLTTVVVRKDPKGKTLETPKIQLAFKVKRGKTTLWVSMDTNLAEDGTLQIDRFGKGKFEKLTHDKLMDFLNYRIKNSDKYFKPFAKHLKDAEVANVLKEVVPDNIDDIKLNATIDFGFSLVPKAVTALTKKRRKKKEKESGTKYDSLKQGLYNSIRTVDKKHSPEVAINILGKMLTHLNAKTEGEYMNEPGFVLTDKDRAVAKELLVDKYKELQDIKENTTPSSELSLEDLQHDESVLEDYQQIQNLMSWEDYMSRKNEDGTGLRLVTSESFEAATKEWEELAKTYNESNPPSHQDVPFKIAPVANQSESKLDWNRARQELRRILPDFISVKELDTILSNLVNSGIAVGTFLDSTVYLGSNASMSTVYHEAFHAVFRTLLTDAQLNRIYRRARTRYGKPTKSDLTNLRNSVSSYKYLDESTLINLWYEEKMAEEFESYVNKRKDRKIPNFLQRIFNKIRKLISWITRNRDDIDLLFSDIYAGSFKNANRKHNIFTSRNNPPVFALLTKKSKFGERYNTKFFDQKISNAVINTIARNVYNRKELDGEVVTDDIIYEEIENMRERFSIDNWTTELEALKEQDPLKMLEVSKQIGELYRALQPGDAITPNNNYDTIIREARRRINLFIDSTLEKEMNEDYKEDTTDAENWRKASTEIGGFGSMSREMKMHISFIPVQVDIFGLGKFIDIDLSDDKFTMSADGYEVYNGVARVLADTPKANMLDKLFKYSIDNDQIGSWAYVLLNDIRNELPAKYESYDLEEITKLPYEVLSESNWYNRFIATFNKTKVNYYTVLFDPETGRLRTFNANQRDVADIQFEEWAALYESKGLTSSQATSILNNIKDLIETKAAYRGVEGVFKSTGIDNRIKLVQDEFNKLGIRLSKGYIRYNIINFHLDSINEDIEELGLSLEQKEYLIELKEYHNAFQDIALIHDEDGEGINRLELAARRAQDNPAGFFVEIEGDETTGAVGRLKKLARANSIFDETVGESTFQNAEGKTIYDKINPSYYTEETKRWASSLRRQFIHHLAVDKIEEAKESLREALNYEGQYISDYDLDALVQVLRYNPLIRGLDYAEYDSEGYRSTKETAEMSEVAEAIFSNIRLYIIDGIRQTNLDESNKELSYGAVRTQAKSFRKLDQRGKALMNLIYFADSSSTMNRKKIGNTKREFRLFNIGVNAEKSTAYLTQLPVLEHWKDGKLTELGKEWFRSFFLQEYNRIIKIQNEIEQIEAGDKTDNIIEGVHNGDKRGIKLFNFKNMPNASRWETLAQNNHELTDEEIAELDSDLNSFAQQQFEEYLEVLSKRNVAVINKERELTEEGELVETGEYTNNILPSYYLTNDKPDLEKLGHFFFNDYFNSYAFTALLDGDYATNFKSPEDVVKRNSGKVASGPDLGGGTTKIGIVKTQELPIESEEEVRHGVTTTTGIGSDGQRETDTIDTTDAQTYGSVDFYLNYLKSQGKYPSIVKFIYKKIKRGITLTNKERNILKDLNADMRPRKIVGRDRMLYLKTSLYTLSRETTSYTDKSDEWLNERWDAYENTQDQNERERILDEIHFSWKPIPGRESLHYLINRMEKTGEGLLAFDSAVKTAKRDVGEYDAEIGWNFKSFEINNEILREQVITDGNKSEIVDSTQKLGLIWSEQDPNAKGVFKSKEVSISDAVSAYDSLLGERVNRGISKKRKSLFENPERGNESPINYQELFKAFRQSLEASGSDPYLLELFSVDTNGNLKYNWNFPAISTKYENMWLAFVSKQTLKQKAPGRKYTLVSDFGMNIIEYRGKVIPTEEFRKNPKKGAISRRLKHRVEDPNNPGKYYSEAIISKSMLEKFDWNVGNTITIPSALAEQVGVRIPTQDKHSMVTLKIVDTTPEEYGNMIVLPREIILLSGADFDIDALYSRVYESFKFQEGYLKFGNYLESPSQDEAIKRAFREYLASIKSSREYRELIRKYLKEEVTVDLDQGLEAVFNQLMDTAKEKLSDRALKALREPTTLKEFEKKYGDKVKSNLKAYKAGNIRSIDSLTDQELNNLLLDLEVTLVHNKGNKEVSATPATLTKFSELSKELEEAGLITKEEMTAVHDAASKSKASNSIDVGAEGIGPAALFNIMFQRLHQANVSINPLKTEEGNRVFSPLLDKYESFTNFTKEGKIVNEAGERINDLLSTILSAMTDNAKEQIASAYNLSVDTLGTALTMIGLGVPFDVTMLLMKQESIGLLADFMALSKGSIKTKEENDSYKRGEGSLQALVERVEEYLGDPTGEVNDVPITKENLKRMLSEADSPNKSDDYIAFQKKVLIQFAIANQYSESLRNLSKVLGLNKGMNPTWPENEQFNQAFTDLGLRFKDGKGNDIDDISIINAGKDSSNKPLPFNYYPIVEESSYIQTNLKTRRLIELDSRKFFIANTNTAKEIIERVKINFKEGNFDYKDNFKDLRNQMLSYFQVQAYKHMAGREFSINSLFSSEAHDTLLELLNNSNFKDNRLLRFFRPPSESITDYKDKKDHIFRGNELKKLVGNTRTNKNPDLVESLMSAYKELYFANTGNKELDQKAKNMAQLIFDQVAIKDNFQFRNNSIVRQIEPFFLGKAMKALTAVQDLLAGKETITDINGNTVPATFEAVFGKDRETVVREFEELFSRYSENNFSLKSNKLEAILSGQKELDDKPIFYDNDTGEMTINLFAGGKDQVSKNWKIIHSGIFLPGNVGIIFPRVFRANDGKVKRLFRLKEVRLKGKKLQADPGGILDGYEAVYEQVPSVGSKEVMPYAFTPMEWDVWIEKNRIQNEETTEEDTSEDNAKVGTELGKLTKEEQEAYEVALNILGTTEDAINAVKRLRGKEEAPKEDLPPGMDREDYEDAVQTAMDILDISRKEAEIHVKSTLGGQLGSHFERLSVNKAKGILDKLKSKFGIDYEFSTDIPGLGMYDNVNNKVIINPNKVRLDTPFHEFAHPFISVIKSENPTLYRGLIRQIKRDTSIVQDIRDRYESRYRSYFSKKGLSGASLETAINNAVYEEAIVTAMGQYAANNIKSDSLIAKISEFLSAIADFIRDLVTTNKDIVPSEIPVNASIQDLAAMMNLDNKIILNSLGSRDLNNTATQEKLNQLGFKKGKCK